MRFIGFHRPLTDTDLAGYDEETPDPDLSTTSYPPQEVAQYLLSGYPVLDVTELTKDAIGGAFRVPGGSSVLTDGSSVWRLDLASYVQHYPIPLPREFLKFIEDHEYKVPLVERERLLEISLLVGHTLGFHSAPGAGPKPTRKPNISQQASKETLQ